METDKTLYGWYFTFNPYTNTWNALFKDDIRAYWNGDDSNMKPIYSDTVFDKLVEKVKNGQS